jgi:hypothetical protein
VESSECVFPVSIVLLLTNLVPDSDVLMRISVDECSIIDRYDAAQ